MFKLIDNNAVETYNKRYTEVLQELTSLKARITDLELESESLRNKVLRKIQKTQDTSEEQKLIRKAGQALSR